MLPQFFFSKKLFSWSKHLFSFPEELKFAKLCLNACLDDILWPFCFKLNFIRLVICIFFLLTFQSPMCGNSHESVQSRRVVISHNMDKALKEGKDEWYSNSWFIGKVILSSKFNHSSCLHLALGIVFLCEFVSYD